MISNDNMEETEKKVNFLKKYKKKLIFDFFSSIMSPDADVAQLVELLICNQWVRGSSPCVGTILLNRPKRPFF